MDWSPLFISLTAAFQAMAFSLIFGTVSAWGVIKVHGRLRAVLDGVLTLPLVLPPTVMGFFLLVLFGSRLPLGRFLSRIGMPVVFNRRATVIAAATVSFPLAYRTIQASFEQIDSAIVDAARTLGLEEWRIFLRIMIPTTLPGIAAGAILSFARALGEFGATLMLAGDIPGHTETIPIAIWSAAEAGHNDRAALWVIIIVSISFISTLLMNAFISRPFAIKHLKRAYEYRS